MNNITENVKSLQFRNSVPAVMKFKQLLSIPKYTKSLCKVMTIYFLSILWLRFSPAAIYLSGGDKEGAETKTEYS